LYALPPGSDKLIGRHTIEVLLAERLGVDLTRAEKLLVAIG
jgi:hypothetical protein